ncbi:MAG: FixH family protein [Bacteroidia bacterium]|nr:FixH family protein [Bacteroidia bacterium]
MNWGKKIALVYTVFAVSMISVTVYCSQLDINLVTPEYYEKELGYEAHIAKARNAGQLAEPLQISYAAGEKNIMLNFPAGMTDIRGEVNLYRPSDSRLDKNIPVSLEDRQQKIAAGDLKPGLWRVKVEWESREGSYFQEKSLFIQ